MIKRPPVRATSGGKLPVMTYIPPTLLKRLDKVADEQHCSRSYLVARAIRDMLERKAA